MTILFKCIIQVSGKSWSIYGDPLNVRLNMNATIVITFLFALANQALMTVILQSVPAVVMSGCNLDMTKHPSLHVIAGENIALLDALNADRRRLKGKNIFHPMNIFITTNGKRKNE